MIRKSGNRFSEEIMLKQRDQAMIRFNLIGSWSRALVGVIERSVTAAPIIAVVPVSNCPVGSNAPELRGRTGWKLSFSLATNDVWMGVKSRPDGPMSDFRFTPQSRLKSDIAGCPKSATSGLIDKAKQTAFRPTISQTRRAILHVRAPWKGQHE
jgi:hypothetical protein